MPVVHRDVTGGFVLMALHHQQHAEEAAGIPCAFGEFAAMFEIAVEHLRGMVGQELLERLTAARVR